MSEEKKSSSVKTSEDKPNKDIEENKAIAALSYVWVLCLIPLLTKKKSKFAQFHAKQGLVLFIIEIIGTFIFWIPFIGWTIAVLLLVVAIIGVLKALNGEWWKIPYVYDWSKKFNL
ncbi:DUF4870 domain-containing protein [Candidatus Parcubacteria bacterium]|nr:DUF4870 domain-containing protein [Candidatus Parcubacteria bacterium]